MITFGKFDINSFGDASVVTDTNLSGLYNLTGENVFLLPQGEQAKSLLYVKNLCSWFLSRGVEKDSLVVAVGGGSVGDLVGFCASVYKRGVKLLQVPTTLLSQIDSSIGGKTAIDLGGIKNAVGTIYSADTLIDTEFLKTLPESEMLNGYGELLKYRMLSPEIDEIAESAPLEKVIEACVSYKMSIVERDMQDNGERRLLNFGHTVGHALELYYKLSHGVAVANGLYYETLLAHKLELCSLEYLNKWQAEIKSRFEIVDLSREVLKLTAQDKKNQNGLVCFVLPTGEKFSFEYISLQQAESLLLG